jgi:hypothetical protein
MPYKINADKPVEIQTRYNLLAHKADASGRVSRWDNNARRQFFREIQSGFISMDGDAYRALNLARRDGTYSDGMVHCHDPDSGLYPAQALVLYQDQFVVPGSVLVQKNYGSEEFESIAVLQMLTLMDSQPARLRRPGRTGFSSV